MASISTAFRIGRGAALGLLLVAFGGAAGAVDAVEAPLAHDSGSRQLELIPASHAAELPPELRSELAAESPASALGLASSGATHKVRLHWLVRGTQPSAGYRVTLVAESGLPGHLAARWLVPTTDGTPVAGGLTSYSTELSLDLAVPVPVAAAIEAVEPDGSAVLLGVRHAIAQGDPVAPHLSASSSPAVAAAARVFERARNVPSAKTELSAGFAPLPASPSLPVPDARAVRAPALRGLLPPRGPPADCLTT